MYSGNLQKGVVMDGILQSFDITNSGFELFHAQRLASKFRREMRLRKQIRARAVEEVIVPVRLKFDELNRGGRIIGYDGHWFELVGAFIGKVKQGAIAPSSTKVKDLSKHDRWLVLRLLDGSRREVLVKFAKRRNWYERISRPARP